MTVDNKGLPPLGQHSTGILRTGLILHMDPDAGLEVVYAQVGGLQLVVEWLQPAMHVGKLQLEALYSRPLFMGSAVHLLAHNHNLYQILDFSISKNVGADFLSDFSSKRRALSARATLPRFCKDRLTEKENWRHLGS